MRNIKEEIKRKRDLERLKKKVIKKMDKDMKEKIEEDMKEILKGSGDVTIMGEVEFQVGTDNDKMDKRIKSLEDRKEQIIRELALTFLKKNKDYGDSFTKSLDKHGEVAGIVRIEDKINRIMSYKDNGGFLVEDEKIIDTVRDLILYSAMFIAWRNNNYKIREIVYILNSMINIDTLGVEIYLGSRFYLFLKTGNFEYSSDEIIEIVNQVIH